MRYRRASLPGASYFFTVNLAERKSRLLVEHVDVLRDSVRSVKTTHPFVNDAMVIMPDHLHALWMLPESDSDFSTRWGLIKSEFARHLEAAKQKVSGVFGNADFGNILSGMTTTLNAMSIIFIIIRSNMAWCCVLWTGRCQVFIATSDSILLMKAGHGVMILSGWILVKINSSNSLVSCRLG